MNANLHTLGNNSIIDSKQKLHLGNSRTFSLSIVVLYIYLTALATALFALNQLTNRSGNSFRVSLQSRLGFGTEPSTLTVITSLLIAFIFYLCLMPLVKKKNFASSTETFASLLLPSGILFTVTMSQFFLGKIDLRNSGFSIISALQQVWLGNFWTRILSYGICVFVVVAYLMVLRRTKKFDRSNSIVAVFLPWWLPLIVDLSFLVTSKVTLPISTRYFLWLTLSVSSTLVLGFALTQYKKLASRLVLAFFGFVMTFIALYLRRPTQVLTWRPNLILQDLSAERFFLFAAIVAFLVSFSMIGMKQLFRRIQFVTGGLWALFSVPFATFNVASADNFHYGEFMGSWFNTNALGLIPYRDIEYSRGLLTHYIPASFGNFLSPGFPESFNYWFVFLSFLIGIYFTFVMKSLLPLPLVFTLLMILPKANGYHEIDILMLLTLVNLIAGLADPRYRKISTYLLFPTCIFWILLTPGQGIILSCLAITAFIYVYFSNFREMNIFLFSRQSLIPLLVTIFFTVVVFRALLPAISWVIRNSPVNNQLFGSGWLNQSLAPEDFPISLRFVVLVIAPVLFLYVLSRFSMFDFMGRVLAVLTILYLILISGRWFGRVDSNTMSRIGTGFLIALIILVLPLLFNLYRRKYFFNSLQTPTLVLIFVFALSWNPFNVNSFVPRQPATIVQDANYSLMLERGNTYRRISDFSQSLFGSQTRMLNLTGANALDQYLRIPGLGGIHSPYVVTNDPQEIDWLDRIKIGNPNFILGGYGSLGSGAYDGAGLGGRAPQVLTWIILNYEVSDCGEFIAAVPKKDFPKLRIKLENEGCTVPSNQIENLSLWSRMDSTPLDLGSSLLSWPIPDQQNSDLINIDRQSVQISLQDLSDPLRFRLKCKSPENALFSISSTSQRNPINFSFSARVESGEFAFKPAIFPITTLLNGQIVLTLRKSLCEFF